jgi:hypothetical protein
VPDAAASCEYVADGELVAVYPVRPVAPPLRHITKAKSPAVAVNVQLAAVVEEPVAVCVHVFT